MPRCRSSTLRIITIVALTFMIHGNVIARVAASGITTAVTALVNTTMAIVAVTISIVPMNVAIIRIATGAEAKTVASATTAAAAVHVAATTFVRLMNATIPITATGAAPTIVAWGPTTFNTKCSVKYYAECSECPSSPRDGREERSAL